MITTDEPTVVAEPLFDAIVMEGGQSDGCLADSTGTNESDGFDLFGQVNNFLDQFVTSKTGLRCWGR